MHVHCFAPSSLARSRARSALQLAAGLTSVLALAAPGHAQGPTELPSSTTATSGSGGSMSSDASWWRPGSGHTAIGLNVGRSTFKAPCGSVFACDDTDRYWTLYGRNMVNEHWGGELGFVDMGRMDRGGGTTRARGLNVSLVGKVPFAQGFGAFGKVGAMYGRTRTSTAAGADIAGGNDNGFGLSVGAGLSWDFTPQVSAVLEWDRYNFKF